MEFKGTKGEWRIFRHLAEVWVGTGSMNVCKLHFENHKEEDARLISAAPDMLEALQTWEAANALGDDELLVKARTLRSMAIEKALAEKDANL